MKEQEDIKQDFDRWLTRQWVEEEYVPTSVDRNMFIQKITKHKQWKKRVKFTGIIFCLLAFMGLLYITSLNKGSKKKTNFIPEKQAPVQLINNPKESAQVMSPLIPVQYQDFIEPTFFSLQRNNEVLEIPSEEILTFKEDLFLNAHTQEVDLDRVMKNLGIFYLQSSTSNEESEFAGVTAGHELILASLVNGTFSLPNAPDTAKTTGGFRPLGMASNRYVQYAFYDVRQLLFNEAIYRKILSVNVLPQIAYNMRTSAPGWNNPVDMQMRQDVPQVINNAARYQDQNIRRISRQAEPKNPYFPYKIGRPSYLRQPIRLNNMAKVGLLIGDNFLIKSQGEKVLVVSCDAERVSVVKQNGVIEASHSITIKEPRYFSQKAKYPFYDEESRRLFLIVETNFSYLWFEVNQLTGEARYIFKTDTIWNGPNWTIHDGTLTYTFKGKSYQRRLD